MRNPVFLIFLVAMVITSCTGNSKKFTPDFKEDEILWGIHYLADEMIEEQIRSSDFCITGKVKVQKKEIIQRMESPIVNGVKVPLPEEKRTPVIWRVTGLVEIDSLVYGDPKTKGIPFSTVQRALGRPSGFKGEIIEYDQWESLNPKEGDTFIIMAKATAENITIIRVIERKDMKPAVECYKTIKDIESLDKNESLKQRNKLLIESNNLELLLYLYRQIIKDKGIDGALVLIETLLTRGKTTSNLKSLGYLLTIHILDVHRGVIYIPEIHDEYYKNLTPSQIETLENIIRKILSESKTIQEGINYIRELTLEILAQNRVLYEDMRKITDNLSQRFANNPDYPEWEKWVAKIFPPEQPEK